jgi:hypothetical protein
MGRILAQQGDGLPSEIEGRLEAANERFTRMLEMVLPSLSKEDLAWRIHFVTGGMIHMLSNQDEIRRLSGGAGGGPSKEAALERFIRFACAGLREGVEVVEKMEAVEKMEKMEKVEVVEKGKIVEKVEESPQAVFNF